MPVHHQAQGAGDVTVHKIENMGSLGNNGYIIICPETNQAVCIDTPDEPEKMINEVRDAGVEVQAHPGDPRPRRPPGRLQRDHRQHRRPRRHRRAGCPPAARAGAAAAQRRRHRAVWQPHHPVHPHAGPHRRLDLLCGGRVPVLRRHPVPRRTRDAPAAQKPWSNCSTASTPSCSLCPRTPTCIPDMAPITPPSARPSDATASSCPRTTRPTCKAMSTG